MFKKVEEFQQITGDRYLRPEHVDFLDWLRAESGLAFVWPDDTIDTRAGEASGRALGHGLMKGSDAVRTGNPQRSGGHFVPWSTAAYLKQSPERGQSVRWSIALRKTFSARGLTEVITEEKAASAKPRILFIRLAPKAVRAFQTIATRRGAKLEFLHANVYRPAPLYSQGFADVFTGVAANIDAHIARREAELHSEGVKSDPDHVRGIKEDIEALRTDSANARQTAAQIAAKAKHGSDWGLSKTRVRNWVRTRRNDT